jgi:riboflavin kinase/FMN adenylyltransferase
VTATRVVRQENGLEPLSDGSVVTIGAYDGVHQGHQKVLRLVRELADARGLDAALVTFDRHPAQVVRPESAPKLLTSLDEKLELLSALDLLDVVCVLRFDEARSHETAEEFVREVLVGLLHARVVVVGADFHFGHQRGGNVALLETMGKDLGFEVLGLGLVAPEGDPNREPFSSTRVRGALANGDVDIAARLLGHPHVVRGTVVRGDQRGRELGFPTANVAVPDEICLPADGIYAGEFCGGDGVWRPAAISLGRRPTFYENAELSLLEAYLLDFEGDLYDQPAAVRFVARLRGEQRFESVEALVEQMGKDVEATRRLLGP